MTTQPRLDRDAALDALQPTSRSTATPAPTTPVAAAQRGPRLP
ncbi:hypothetical protein AB0B10_25620 [Micromonospora arborensis]